MSFESPRVGNQVFAEEFDRLMGDSVFRVTRDKDPVPHFPIQDLGFQHVAREVFYSESGKYVFCASGESDRCSGQFDWKQLILPQMAVSRQELEHCGGDFLPYPLAVGG